jgi:hypothetical protein
MEAPSVPVIIDDVKDLPDFKLSRCTYFTIECEESLPETSLGTKLLRMPVLTLGMVGLVHAPLEDDEFSEVEQIEKLLAAVEQDERLEVETSDIWLPNEALALAKGKGKPTRGDLFRLSHDLFLLAHQHRRELLSNEQLTEACAGRGAEMRYSARETEAFQEWMEAEIKSAVKFYHDHEKLALKYEDPDAEGEGGTS